MKATLKVGRVEIICQISQKRMKIPFLCKLMKLTTNLTACIILQKRLLFKQYIN